MLNIWVNGITDDFCGLVCSKDNMGWAGPPSRDGGSIPNASAYTFGGRGLGLERRNRGKYIVYLVTMRLPDPADRLTPLSIYSFHWCAGKRYCDLQLP